MSEQNLLKTVTEFRKGILDKRPSDGMCFAVCAPLRGFLSMCGTETAMVQGDFDGYINHVWLKLADGRIIDPTADQLMNLLGRSMPPVYVGPKPAWYPDEILEAS